MSTETTSLLNLPHNVLVRVLQGAERKKFFTIRTWLIQLWRLRCPKFCICQAGKPVDLMVQIHSETESEDRRLVSQLKDCKAEKVNSPLLSLFILFRPSTDQVTSTSTGEGNLLLLSYLIKY